MIRKLSSAAAVLLTSSAAFAASHADTSVTVVLSEELDIVDPCEASRSNVGRVVLQNISETMTELVPGEGLQTRLATGWEDLGDGTWQFTLREGVNFHDGSAFDAADVAHSLARIKSEDITCEIGAKFFGGTELTTEVVDDHTINITADPVQPILPLLMSTVTVVPSDTPMDSHVETPIGTGPYMFDEYNRGQNIKLSQNENYWGESPAVTDATYVFRSDSAVRAAMVAQGEADIAPNIALQDASNPEMDFSYPNSESVYMRLDTTMEPLDDKRVREALNYAVDREAFIGTILADGTLLATSIVPPSTLGYNEELEPYPYDPERAKELLAEAEADGVPVDLEITFIGRLNNWGNVTETLEALTAMWEEVGFNIDLQMVEVAEWLEYYSQPFPEDRGPTIVAAMHDNANGDPVFSMYFKYDSEGLQSGVRDPALDAMIADATTATGDERERLWKDIMHYIHTEQVYDVLLFHMVGFSRVNPRLDFTPTIRTNSELQLSQITFN
ncbi:ABC transporter substrate-binding protein [Psychromarinibacter sp. C21-152]|uniref:ABC transporter substrate-binding protein n=1 Tax=Psychromarinibacter sediminicola TaxID=3033385 RepID=A0AAE3NPX9_9RHOB|nr:ABC transporter substrate-binding protein [Psychromarinibacter sediminicola]MDF0600289.1 ABC transporter substrate-binding protein [Psychromarinibacter sediminicola]